jgi:hypothetical protein
MIHSTTTARHPQTNAQAEVVNKTIARYLAAFVDESTLDWEAYLPALMFSYNTSFHRAIKTSPFFLTYGVQPNIPKDFNIDYKQDTATDIMSKLQLARYLAKQHIEEAQTTSKHYYDKNIKTQTFYKNQPVLLDEHYYLNRNQKIAPKFTGPHLVIQLKGETNVELLLNNGKTTIVHVNRIKPYISRENLPQHVLKPEKGSGNKKTQEDEDVFSDKDDIIDIPTEHVPEQVPRINDNNTPIRRPTTRTDPILTRSQTKQRQLVYNNDSHTFEHPSPDEAIEALRRKTKKKILHRKIQDQQGFILVEDVYYQVQDIDTRPIDKVTPQVTDEPRRPPHIKIEEEEPTELQYTTPPQTPYTNSPPVPYPDPPPVSYLDPPPAEDIKPKIRPTSPPPKTSKPTFAKELLDSATKFLLPTSKRRSIDRPLKGTSKSYAQMLEEMLGPEDTLPPQTENDNIDTDFVPELIDPKMEPKTEPTEEEHTLTPSSQPEDPPVATGTRSHHPKLEPGIP